MTSVSAKIFHDILRIKIILFFFEGKDLECACGPYLSYLIFQFSERFKVQYLLANNVAIAGPVLLQIHSFSHLAEQFFFQFIHLSGLLCENESQEK